MPALPNAAQILKVTMKGTIQGVPWNVVLHSRYTGASPTASQLTTYSQVYFDAWNANLVPLAMPTTFLTKVAVADLSSQTASFIENDVTDSPGQRTGAAPPNQVCCVSSWQVQLRYRGGHCRSYWPIGAMADITNGHTWTSTFLTAALAAFRAFRTQVNAAQINANPVPLVMLSYYTNRALRPAPLPVTIDDVKVGSRIDTQRRRVGKETL